MFILMSMEFPTCLQQIKPQQYLVSKRLMHKRIEGFTEEFSGRTNVIRVFSNESALCIWWPEYWSFSFSISPSNEYSGLISVRMDCWISLQSKGLSRVFSNTTVQKHQFLYIYIFRLLHCASKTNTMLYVYLN